jgi:AcrR family transcriptional regulator
MGTAKLDTVHPTAQRLLDAAVATISRRGEAGLRVEELVKEVGVAVTAVYHHFGSREGLVAAAQAERFDLLVAENIAGIASIIERSTTAAEFRSTFLAFITDRLDNTDLAIVFARVNALGSTFHRPDAAAVVGERIASSRRATVEAFRPAVERGWIRPEADIEVMAQWYTAATMGRAINAVDTSFADRAAMNAVTVRTIDRELFA